MPQAGTSNDRRDAWFGGFNSLLSAVVWVGYDDYQPLGPGEEGSRTALPLWIDFMRDALRGAPTSAMPMPEGIVTVRINTETGCPATAADHPEEVMFEIFEVGSVPRCENQEEPVDIFNQSGDDSDEERVDPIF